jgi:hypothetical protein
MSFFLIHQLNIPHFFRKLIFYMENQNTVLFESTGNLCISVPFMFFGKHSRIYNDHLFSFYENCIIDVNLKSGVNFKKQITYSILSLSLLPNSNNIFVFCRNNTFVILNLHSLEIQKEGFFFLISLLLFSF